MEKVKPILLGVTRDFDTSQTSGGEWATEYSAHIGNSLNTRFSLRKFKREPEALGYNFWLLARSEGYSEVTEDINESDIRRALVLERNDIELVRNYLTRKIDAIGAVSWDELERKLGEFLDTSDIQDDARPDTKGE